MVVGCQAARVDQPVVAKLGGVDPDTQMDFWHTLADQSVTSNDDALHGLLIYLDGSDDSQGYDQRVQKLIDRGLLPANFSSPAEEGVTRGTLAVALVKTLKVRGGLMMSLFGPNPRYAVKELEFLDLFPPSSPNQTFSGTEFLGVIGKLEDYQRGSDFVADDKAEQLDKGMPQPTPAQPGQPPQPIAPQSTQ